LTRRRRRVTMEAVGSSYQQSAFSSQLSAFSYQRSAISSR
jgi:hypothetical protein